MGRNPTECSGFEALLNALGIRPDFSVDDYAHVRGNGGTKKVSSEQKLVVRSEADALTRHVHQHPAAADDYQPRYVLAFVQPGRRVGDHCEARTMSAMPSRQPARTQAPGP